MLRHSLVLAAAGLVVMATTVCHAQSRKREDLLDDLTTHIQICAEINDSQSRLACYDKLQTRVGDVQAPAPTPTPLRAGTSPAPPPAAPVNTGTTGGAQVSGAPLAPPPLTLPGGGVATLGGGGGGISSAPGGGARPPTVDPDAAFDPRSATSAYRPPEGLPPKPQPPVRRSGPRAIPNFTTPQPLVTLAANNLTYGDTRYWQVTISITSNTPRTLDTQVRCTFLNAGRPISEANFGPTSIAPGEQITTELIGPPTTAYIDSTNCRVLSP
jgi:hypothetical protein